VLNVLSEILEGIKETNELQERQSREWLGFRQAMLTALLEYHTEVTEMQRDLKEVRATTAATMQMMVKHMKGIETATRRAHSHRMRVTRNTSREPSFDLLEDLEVQDRQVTNAVHVDLPVAQQPVEISQVAGSTVTQDHC